MAKNLVFANARHLKLTWTTADSTGGDSDFKSGQPIMVGRIPGVVLVDSTGNKVVVDTGGAYSLTVRRPTTAGAAQGDKVFFAKASRQIHYASTASGFTSTNPPFGYLLNTIASGAAGPTTNNTVKIIPSG